jgi:hypothetical protein
MARKLYEKLLLLGFGAPLSNRIQTDAQKARTDDRDDTDYQSACLSRFGD